MESPYRDKWRAEIAALKVIVASSLLREERKWGQPCYTLDGANVVIIGAFKAYVSLGFFQGALLKDPQKLLVQLGSVRAARVMKFTSTDEIAAKAATIKAYVREAIDAARAGKKVELPPVKLPIPDELTVAFKKNKRLQRAFEALTPGRQRGYLHHFNGAKQSATRAARIQKATPDILAGRGLLDRPRSS